MTQAELNEYFDGSKKLRLLYGESFVDYEDIESPLKAVLKGVQNVTINPK